MCKILLLYVTFAPSTYFLNWKKKRPRKRIVSIRFFNVICFVVVCYISIRKLHLCILRRKRYIFYFFQESKGPCWLISSVPSTWNRSLSDPSFIQDTWKEHCMNVSPSMSTFCLPKNITWTCLNCTLPLPQKLGKLLKLTITVSIGSLIMVSPKLSTDQLARLSMIILLGWARKPVSILTFFPQFLKFLPVLKRNLACLGLEITIRGDSHFRIEKLEVGHPPWNNVRLITLIKFTHSFLRSLYVRFQKVFRSFTFLKSSAFMNFIFLSFLQCSRDFWKLLENFTLTGRFSKVLFSIQWWSLWPRSTRSQRIRWPRPWWGLVVVIGLRNQWSKINSHSREILKYQH